MKPRHAAIVTGGGGGFGRETCLALGAIKIEQLWRQLPADGIEMTEMVETFRQLYNHVRPHETLHGDRPIERYLADPDQTPPAPINAPLPTRQTTRIP